MSDAFALLGLPRQAALDAETVKAAYLERCRSAHPDQAGGDPRLSADLNAAYELLSEPEGRLKHLLELEAGNQASTWATVPMDEPLMSLFSRLGAVLARLDAWAQKRDAAASALARALLAGEQMRLQENVEAVLADLDSLRRERSTRLQVIDHQRQHDPAAAIESARALRAQFAYLGKWTAQAREARLRLVE